MPIRSDKIHIHTHLIDSSYLLSLFIPLSLPVTTLKTSLSTTNNDYLFFTHNRKMMYNFLFLVELTSSHSCTHSRIERSIVEGRKKRKRATAMVALQDTVLNCTINITDFVNLLHIFIYALEKVVKADACSL